jgi:hypothetical protein
MRIRHLHPYRGFPIQKADGLFVGMAEEKIATCSPIGSFQLKLR